MAQFPTKKKLENTFTTTMSFDRDTYKRLKILAIERDTSTRILIRQAVDRLLADAKKGKGTT